MATISQDGRRNPNQGEAAASDSRLKSPSDESQPWALRACRQPNNYGYGPASRSTECLSPATVIMRMARRRPRYSTASALRFLPSNAVNEDVGDQGPSATNQREGGWPDRIPPRWRLPS
ncbi:protein of unknown function [Methylocella tundrae]|uniref:Uncharacterized protein n=1 Tax=Methylocella tundrae TaxID=227605 RepID=A0A4U8Z1X4_METTU|nr:protein of unknown function [Methylocella tundrae]